LVRGERTVETLELVGDSFEDALLRAISAKEGEEACCRGVPGIGGEEEMVVEVGDALSDCNGPKVLESGETMLNPGWMKLIFKDSGLI
jgi:hypothetical protein